MLARVEEHKKNRQIRLNVFRKHNIFKNITDLVKAFPICSHTGVLSFLLPFFFPFSEFEKKMLRSENNPKKVRRNLEGMV